MKKKIECSKLLILQESALIWIVTISVLILAFLCIMKGYIGTLPWLSTIIPTTWGAYAIGQGFYYNKAKKENTEGGIVYETAMKEKNKGL